MIRLSVSSVNFPPPALQEEMDYLYAQYGDELPLNWLKKLGTVHVKDELELGKTIHYLIKEHGETSFKADFLDISHLDSLYEVFDQSKFVGDISMWDTRNVKSLDTTFSYSLFNGNLSKWNTSKVISAVNCFADSKFNKPLKTWDMRKLRDATGMFRDSDFNQDISMWDIKSLKYYDDMFLGSKFNQDLTRWVKEYGFDLNVAGYGK